MNPGSDDPEVLPPFGDANSSATRFQNTRDMQTIPASCPGVSGVAELPRCGRQTPPARIQGYMAICLPAPLAGIQEAFHANQDI